MSLSVLKMKLTLGCIEHPLCEICIRYAERMRDTGDMHNVKRMELCLKETKSPERVVLFGESTSRFHQRDTF